MVITWVFKRRFASLVSQPGYFFESYLTQDLSFLVYERDISCSLVLTAQCFRLCECVSNFTLQADANPLRPFEQNIWRLGVYADPVLP